MLGESVKQLFDKIDSYIEKHKKESSESEYHYVLSQETVDKINLMDSHKWTRLLLWESFRYDDESVSKLFRETFDTLFDSLSYSEKQKAYVLLSNKLKWDVYDKEIFKIFFYEDDVLPFWDRVKSIFQKENEVNYIEKNVYLDILNKFENILKRTIRIGLSLEKNNHEAWIENVKISTEIHELCSYTVVDIPSRIKMNDRFVYNHELHQKIREFYKNWYQKTNQTFAAKRQFGHSIYGYFDTLNEYEYLFDDKNKKIVHETLLSMAMDDFMDCDYDENCLEDWIWIKENLRKYLIINETEKDE